ncbi:MAG: TrbG/VirB9 family P-type conjugative transfer protein [Acetobacter sp.]|nr:TrbG/VirB9 family P-type conjugative transfer protein [Acetobacter sp.]MCI1485841.1 TrbG/VirB9 family P-type conjugative transfer protein [Acetobacter sp.]MCI1529777.1 TrbG/VirB9 family P-type conjugative transfer protein [Acetobacter sp.]MCI1587554.1 TrbG/VirB9 family P-type conjugative transfer protein [Acetobacter sp.]MCI1601771.1 TrbG/VirB9 family P-type conjugative transfer protein [Acetobacter sp.]
MLPVASLVALSGCAGDNALTPVTVDVPGMPSPELALQKSLDRINGFLGSLNQRIDTPVRQTTALAVTPSRPIRLTPQSQAPTQPASPIDSAAHEARPLQGKAGLTWFAYGDGYARLHCAPGSLCILRLQPGETVGNEAYSIEPKKGWRTDLVKGTRGIHSTWAMVLTPNTSAQRSVLHITTNRRTYVVVLDPTGPSMRSVAFSYASGDPHIQPDPPPSPEALAKLNTPDFNYLMTGASPSWKPLRIYREGAHTYIQFPPDGINHAPRLVVLSPSNAGTQPYRTVGDSYVVDLPVGDALLIGNEPDSPTIRISHGGKA